MAVLIGTAQIQEGASEEFTWNNPPTGVAHSFTAEAVCPFDVNGLHSTDAILQITSVLFEQQFVKWDPPPQGQIAGTPIFHNRLRVTVKNVGSQLAQCNLFMSWS